MTTSAAIRAKTRNWQKLRLAGSNINHNCLTPSERLIAEKIDSLKKELLKDWDVNSYILANKPMPQYQCSYCGKRGNVPHISFLFGEQVNYCKKHYHHFKD